MGYKERINMKLDYIGINQLIKKADAVYIWCQTCEHDGTYIRTTKAYLRRAINEAPNLFDADKFDLTPYGGLYVN